MSEWLEILGRLNGRFSSEPCHSSLSGAEIEKKLAGQRSAISLISNRGLLGGTSSLREFAAEAIAGKRPPPPIALTLGMKLTGISKGRATFTMEVGKKFHNPMGTVHGGIMTDLADAAMGIAVANTLKEGEVFTTLELKMNFLRPVFRGKLTAKGRVLHRGRTIALVESTVRDEKGRVVAKGTATQMILNTNHHGGVTSHP